MSANQQDIINKFRVITREIMDGIPSWVDGKDIDIKFRMDNDDFLNNTVTVEVYEVIRKPKEGTHV